MSTNTQTTQKLKKIPTSVSEQVCRYYPASLTIIIETIPNDGESNAHLSKTMTSS
jgi:hypothetical protein